MKIQLSIQFNRVKSNGVILDFCYMMGIRYQLVSKRGVFHVEVDGIDTGKTFRKRKRAEDALRTIMLGKLRIVHQPHVY